MHRKLIASAAGVLLSVALIAAGPAAAVAPPSALVRVEGAGATLLPQTLVQTTGATTVRGKACPGTSAGGALQLATGGNWGGSYDLKLNDFLVSSILGETPTGTNFWTLWVNGISSTTGACATLLHPGDHELWFDCVADASFNCTNNPLKVSVPAVARVARELTASVTQLDGAGHSAPIAGAAVTGIGVAGISGTGGNTRIVPHQTGVIQLQAAKTGATPSDPVFLCVYKRSASECGPLSSGPQVHVRGIHEHQVFKVGPRQLQGTAGPDPSGLTDVSLSLRRRAPNRTCSYYDAGRGSWHGTSCTSAAPRFSIGAGQSWSYLLPRPLAAGSYRLVVLARDGNGRQTKVVTARSAIDFRVKR